MNPRIFALVFGIAVGYVIGARAGRERYDALKSAALTVWDDPRVVKVRTEVEDYAKEQAPVIRERAEAIAKAAPGAIADSAKAVAEAARDAAEATAEVTKEVAAKASTLAKDVAGKSAAVAKDVAEKSTAVAKDVAEKSTAVVKDVAERSSEVAKDVADRAKKVASDVRDRGEAVVDRAVIAVGEAREGALELVEDPDDENRG